MLWIVQSNLHRERGYDRLLDALDRLGCDRVWVKPVPFSRRLLPGDFDAPKAVDLEDVPEPVVDAGRPVLAMGSYGLAKTAVARGWSPGAFLDNTDYAAWSEGFGHENVLNPHAWTGPLRDAVVRAPAFVRPLADSKSFVGKVYEPEEFRAWQERILALGDDADVTGETPVIAAAPRVVHAETRCFVVAGTIVTASLYRVGQTVRYEEVSDGPALAFARACIARWTPSEAFVLDIAATPDGPKVVEVNCINAAGIYACDTQRLVAAFEAHWPG